jgi:hypothetical protein
MRILKTVCVTGLVLALGSAEAYATALAAPNNTAIAGGADENLDPAVQDLGLVPAPASSDNLTSASASTESSAEPVPELPTWAMMLVLFMGLGLARFKSGRKDRLSSGIE